MTESELSQIEDRAEKATPGPWVGSRDLMTFEVSQKDKDFEEICKLGPEDSLSELHSDTIFPKRWNNAEFIAHARNDIPYLIAEVKNLTEDLRKARAEAFEEAADLEPYMTEGEDGDIDIQDGALCWDRAVKRFQEQIRALAEKEREGKK